VIFNCLTKKINYNSKKQGGQENIYEPGSDKKKVGNEAADSLFIQEML
jgi:hypothetical protein